MNHDVGWHTAIPLWEPALQDELSAKPRFREPAVLRFSGDGFMDEYEQRLTREPQTLADLVVRAETWREEQAGWPTWTERQSETPVKLFQPIHNRFYLVTASLCCRIGGLPDRKVDLGAGERVSFVMRRLLPKPGVANLDPGDRETFDEYGWFGDRQAGRWMRLNDAQRAADLEERLALFPTSFEFEGRSRRLYAGLIPVSGREVYEQGFADPKLQPDSDQTSTPDESLNPDPRMARFDALVAFNLSRLTNLPDDATAKQAVESLVFTLLDLVEFLQAHVPRVASAIAVADGSSLSGAERSLYDRFVGDPPAPIFDGKTWSDLLREIQNRQAAIASGDLSGLSLTSESLSEPISKTQIQTLAAGLLGGQTLQLVVEAALVSLPLEAYLKLVTDWTERVDAWGVDEPPSRARRALVKWLVELTTYLRRELPLVLAVLQGASQDSHPVAIQNLVNRLQSATLGHRTWGELLVHAAQHAPAILADEAAAEIAVLEQPLSPQLIRDNSLSFFNATLTSNVDAALQAAAATAATGAAVPSGTVDVDTPAVPRPAIYVIRCVYDRPQCRGIHDATVSEPSQPLRLATFFDPDAPTRTVQIRMPEDTSVSGLRKFPRGAIVSLSKSLRQQVERVTGTATPVLAAGGVGGDVTLNLGMVCSMSIPIITICALILLMIVAQILNIVFWWLPLFRICLPVRSES